jgi:hypothetical protein
MGHHSVYMTGIYYYSQNPSLPLGNSYEPTDMKRKIWTVISMHVDQNNKSTFLRVCEQFHDPESGAFT